jgi:hypothetical protein
MRRRAEAEHARRKRERGAKQGKLDLRVLAAEARERFFERQLIFAYRHGSAGRLVHALAWLVHNCLVHPILGLFPCSASVKLHDLSADWLNQSPRSASASLPRIDNRRAWIVHNCLAHFAMGVAPFGPVFRAHDRSAERMNVEGWI